MPGNSTALDSMDDSEHELTLQIPKRMKRREIKSMFKTKQASTEIDLPIDSPEWNIITKHFQA